MTEPAPTGLDRRTFLAWAAATSIGASAFFLFATLVEALMPPERSIDGRTEVGALPVARLSDLQLGKPVLVDYGDDKLFVVKTSHTTARAFDAACPHARCTLGYNEQARRFDCPCHGSSFSIDGRVRRGPAQRDMYAATVEIDGGQVVVTGLES